MGDMAKYDDDFGKEIDSDDEELPDLEKPFPLAAA